MRKSVVMLAILGLASAASAAETKDGARGNAEVAHSGEFRVRHFTNMDEDGQSNSGPSSVNSQALRFKGGLTYRSGDKFTGHLTLLAQSQFGATAEVANQNVEQSSILTGGSSAVVFNEAYGSWMASDELMLKVGRFNPNFGDGSIMSSNDWEQVPYSFDGLMVGYDTEFAKFGGYAVKHTDDGVSAGNVIDRESRSWILTGELKTLPDFIKTAAIHVIQTNTDNVATPAVPRSDVLRYGVTLLGDKAGVDYKVVYDMHSGEADQGAGKVDAEGMMVDAEVGYSLPDLMNLRVHVGYHMDSGGDNNSTGYIPFLYYRHYNAGLQDVLGWGNLSYIHGGVAVSPMEDMEVKLDYLMFTATDDDDVTSNDVLSPAARLAGQNARFARVAGESDLGSEIDLSVKKKYGQDFYIWARYSMFTAGDGLGAVGGGKADDAFSQFFVEAQMNF